MRKILSLIVCLSLCWLTGCENLKPNATPQQIQEAQVKNTYTAGILRREFDAAATTISLLEAQGKINDSNRKTIDELEDAIKAILDEMDVAAVEDPFHFQTLVEQEAFKQGMLLVEIKLIDMLVPQKLMLSAKRTKINQAASDYAFVQSSGNQTISDVDLNQGGLVRSIGGNDLTIRNVTSAGAPSGGGRYFAVVATGAGRNVIIDNTAAPYAWIINGGEAGIRIMGRTKHAVLKNLLLCCRKHDLADGGSGKLLCPLPTVKPDGTLIQPKAKPGQKLDWWKQILQIRDLDDGMMVGGKIIGPFVIGQQEDSTTPQKVPHFVFSGVGMTHEPLLVHKESYGRIERKSCYKIDESGVALKDNKGKIVMWPDRTWVGNL